MFDNEEFEVNQLCYDKRYITKSKITREFKKEYPMLKDIPLAEIKEIFNKCSGKRCRVGNPDVFYQQKHTKFVKKDELAARVFRDYFRLPHQR